MKEYFGRLIEQALPRRPCGKPLEIWFQDEARVGRKWTHAYVRAPIGTRPPVLRDNKFCNLV